MSRKYYVVWAGREPGIFTDWDSCREQVEHFAGARYKSYPTLDQARAAWVAGADAATGPAARAGSRPPVSPVARRGAGRPGVGPQTLAAPEVAAHPATTHIFADGGCEPNPGRSGSGVAVYRHGRLDELWYGLHEPRGTNNTAELRALHQALLIAESEADAGATVAVFCDSKYAIQCVTQWAAGWQRRGWTKPGGDIRNLDLIRPAFALYQELRGRVQVLHVNGHAGIEGNELADRMSLHGIDTREAAFVRHPVPGDIATVLAMRRG